MADFMWKMAIASGLTTVTHTKESGLQSKLPKMIKHMCFPESVGQHVTSPKWKLQMSRNPLGSKTYARNQSNFVPASKKHIFRRDFLLLSVCPFLVNPSCNLSFNRHKKYCGFAVAARRFAWKYYTPKFCSLFWFSLWKWVFNGISHFQAPKSYWSPHDIPLYVHYICSFNITTLCPSMPLVYSMYIPVSSQLTATHCCLVGPEGPPFPLSVINDLHERWQ